MEPEWISALASCVAALGVFLVFIQTRLLVQQMINDHDRSRRENATNLINHFVRTLRRSASDTRRLIENLPQQDQALDIFKFREITIPEKWLDTVQSCLAHTEVEPPTASNGQIRLSKEIVTEIRWQALEYLNLLESVLLAWHHGVADKQIIESEFRYLVEDGERRNAMEDFRKVTGGAEAYPAIGAFVEQIRADAKSKEPKGKPAIATKPK